MENATHTAAMIVSSSYTQGLEPTPHSLYALLYYLQGWHKALLGQWCFDEEIEILEDAPFVQDVYHELGYVYRQGKRLSDAKFTINNLLIGALVNTYGRLPTLKLMNLFKHDAHLHQLQTSTSPHAILMPKPMIAQLFSTGELQDNEKIHRQFLDSWYAQKYSASDWTPQVTASPETLKAVEQFILE